MFTRQVQPAKVTCGKNGLHVRETREFRNNEAWNQIVQAEADIFKSYFVCVENSQGEDKSLSFLRYWWFMLSSIEQLESARDVEYPKFKLLPILSERRKFVTLDNRDMKFLATHAKSWKYTKELNTSIDSKFQSMETFFDFEGVTKDPRK